MVFSNCLTDILYYFFLLPSSLAVSLTFSFISGNTKLKTIPKNAAMKNVENLDVIIDSSGVLIHKMVENNPASTVATTPALEYFFQKNVIKIAGDNVHPTPAQAQLTTKYSRESDTSAITIPNKPKITTDRREVHNNALSESFIPIALWYDTKLFIYSYQFPFLP